LRGIQLPIKQGNRAADPKDQHKPGKPQRPMSGTAQPPPARARRGRALMGTAMQRRDLGPAHRPGRCSRQVRHILLGFGGVAQRANSLSDLPFIVVQNTLQLKFTDRFSTRGAAQYA
jgi:hypothetical protein